MFGCVSEDDVDVDAGAQDVMFGCESEDTELCHASHTLMMATRLRKKENDWRKNGDCGGVGMILPPAGGPRHHVGARGCGDGNSFEEETTDAQER